MGILVMFGTGQIALSRHNWCALGCLPDPPTRLLALSSSDNLGEYKPLYLKPETPTSQDGINQHTVPSRQHFPCLDGAFPVDLQPYKE